jgi:hypothetical protein
VEADTGVETDGWILVADSGFWKFGAIERGGSPFRESEGERGRELNCEL